MDRINELIGIVDGINYDGIINDLEIKSLQKWLKQNRSLDTSTNYSKIVAILEEILLDGAISEEEKEKLVYYANAYRESGSNVNEVLNSLYGIIEGIVCDNVLNDLEIENLSNWLFDNAFLSGVPTYDKINNLVIKILEDKIITKEERASLVSILEEAIIDSKNNLRINRIKRKVLSRENIGIDLIEIIEDERLVNQIHSNAQIQMKKAFFSYSQTINDSEIIFISLTIIALLNYDGNFYGAVRKVYSDIYKVKSAQEVENFIRTVLSRFQTVEQINSPRKINVCLRNAIVPLPFLADFFEFIFDIYKLNFNCSLNDALYKEFKFIYDGLKSDMSADNDTLELSVTKKTYKLTNSTKELIMYSKNISSIIELSIAIIRIINQEYWSEENKHKVNKYIQTGYDNWIKEYHNSRKVKATGKRKVFNSRWEPSLLLSGYYVYLNPPIHKVKDISIYKTMSCVIKNHNKVLYKSDNPIYRQIVGGYEVEFPKVSVADPLGDLSYVIYGDDKVIYDSKDKLHRPVIAFDVNGKEIKNNTDYEGDVVFCYKDENRDVLQYYSEKRYKLGYGKAMLSSVFIFGDFYFNFSSILKPGIFGDKIRHQKIVSEDKIFEVYRSVKYMMFESKLESIKIGISINGKRYKLQDLSATSSVRGNYFRYVITLPINKSKLYSVFAYSLAESKRIKNTSFYFAIDEDFSTSFISINDSNFQVTVKSKFFTKPVVEYVDANEIPNYSIEFEHSTKKLQYNVDFNIPLYRIDNQQWKSINEYIWIDDIKEESVLDVYGSKIKNMDCFEEDRKFATQLIFTKNKRYYSSDISGLRAFKNNCVYVDLIWKDEVYNTMFIRCYNKCEINENLTKIEFDQVDKSLLIQPNYIGRSKVGVRVLDKNNTQVFNKQNIKCDDILLVDNLQMNEKYAIEFYERSAGLLTKKKETIIRRFYKTFYSYESLNRKNFKIEYVTILDELKRKKNYKIKNMYIKLSNKIDLTNYIGDIYQMKTDYSKYMYNISPAEMEIINTDFSDNVQIKIIKDNQFLLYDPVKGELLNSLDQTKGQEILSFSILIE